MSISEFLNRRVVGRTLDVAVVIVPAVAILTIGFTMHSNSQSAGKLHAD
jgi:hypothetical protein